MSPEELSNLRSAIHSFYLSEETDMVERLSAKLIDYDANAVAEAASQLIAKIRNDKSQHSLVASFLHEYRLDSAEGVVLMSIAEALLRIPDSKTQDLLLQDKLTHQLWNEQNDHPHSLLINLSNHALQLAGSIEQQLQSPGKIYQRLFSRLGGPLIRRAIKQAMQLMAYQFVIAESIEQALEKCDEHYRYSFDMLGEAAVTADDAERYHQSYFQAINTLANHANHADIYQNPGISIKLSALYPRYEPLQRLRAEAHLTDRLLDLARQARAANITVTIDAEETERLDMSLNIFQAVFEHPDLQGWHGIGLAIQAYQKRAYAVIQWLAGLAEANASRIPLRLVKGAYWDSEIKRAQENGLNNYPVFTHKSATDIAYLACAELVLSLPRFFYPQFATHNAHTVCAIQQLAGDQPVEFQRLHGMGTALYHHLLKEEACPSPCRIYAPVGNYQDLLPYLVRRLLENGANTSFVNQIENSSTDIQTLSRDPLATYQSRPTEASEITLPLHLFGKQRLNSAGINLADPSQLEKLQLGLSELMERRWRAAPVVNGKTYSGPVEICLSPTDREIILGEVTQSDANSIEDALNSAEKAFVGWRQTSAKERAQLLQKAAELLENHRLELVSLCIREGGRSLTDALSEVREAVDFCRYYAAIAVKNYSRPQPLPGPTGEMNQLLHFGRGIFACISPWNFPMAIFIGQISAALAAGNTVIAKPAQQTPLTAMHCIGLLHRAGIPQSVLQFLPGEGATIGRQLLNDPRIAGVAFTGSTATAALINRQLASKPAIVPLIAETGGQNVMIADSSAHCQQLAHDAAVSAFNSAGQRCSALRVLYVQEEIADRVVDLLCGAMRQLIVGDPADFSTDIGPVIDQTAADLLDRHVQRMKREAKVIDQLPLPTICQRGNFFPPTLIELTSLDQLPEEVFGPILHIIRFRSGNLQQVIDNVNHCGYGLTLGIQSRIQHTIDTIQSQVKVGNIYVNRNMIGAVVGVQPFGGMGLSGTGPKAGGPHYLQRFTVEQTVSINTAALGGNVVLLSRQLD